MSEPTVADVKAAFDIFLSTLVTELSAMARHVAGDNDVLCADIERLHFGCFVRAFDKTSPVIAGLSSMPTRTMN